MDNQQQTDTLYQTYDKNLSKITGSAQMDSIQSMINADQSANNSTLVNIPADLIGSGQSANVQNMANGGIYSAKQRWSDTTPGFFFGIDTDGTAKMNIGNSSSYIQWDGSTLSVIGGVSISSLDIPDTTTTNSFHVDSSGNAWWGSTVLSGSTAKVLNTGAATFSNITITGGAIAGSALNAGSVTYDKISVSSLSAISANIGTITAGTISGITITGSTLTTANSGQRVVLNTNNQSFYDSSINYAGQVYGDTGGMIISTGSSSSALILRGGSSGVTSIGYGSTSILVVDSAGIHPNVDATYNLGSNVRTWNTTYTNTLYTTTLYVNGSQTSGTNTGDQNLSGYATLSGSSTFTGSNTFSNSSTGNYFNWVQATGSAPQVGSTAARFTIKGSDVHYTSLVNDSDRGLKKNIETLKYGLKTIQSLNPVTFEYIKPDQIGGTKLGFIAQDIESIIPEIVSTNDEGMKGLSLTELIPILVNAVKELDARITNSNI